MNKEKEAEKMQKVNLKASIAANSEASNPPFLVVSCTFVLHYLSAHNQELVLLFSYHILLALRLLFFSLKDGIYLHSGAHTVN